MSLFVLGFLVLHWSGFGGGALGTLVQSIGAEVPSPAQIGGGIAVLLLLTLFYVPFVWLSVFDHDWSFEPHRATRRLNLLGVPVRKRTYHVIGATGGPDSLVLRTTDSPDVAVCPSGWGSETDDTLMPFELRQLIRTCLGLREAGR